MVQEALFKLPEIPRSTLKKNNVLCSFPKAVSSDEVRTILADKRKVKEEKENAKKARIEARLKKKAPPPVESSDSESEPDSPDASVGSDESDPDFTPSVGDFVLVRFTSKKSWQCYIGKVLKIDDSDVSSQFLHRQSGSRLCFMYPEEDDIWTHDVADIVSVLPAPTSSGTKDRLRLSFEFDFSKFKMA